MNNIRKLRSDRRPNFEQLEERRLLATHGVTESIDLGEAVNGGIMGTLSWAILQARTDTDPSVRIGLARDVEVRGKLRGQGSLLDRRQSSVI